MRVDYTCKKISSFGFTLVELIVVITILVILGTIAFTNLGGYSSSARDSSRVSDMANFTQALDLTYGKINSYPTPSNGSAVTFSGGLVWTQGSAGDSVMNFISAAGFKFSRKITDQKYANTEYSYSLLNTGREYQVGTVVEDSTMVVHENLPFISTADAAVESLAAYLKGNYNGLVAKALTGTTTVTAYYLALPSITLQSLTNTELSVPAAQSGNLVLHKKGNIPSTYTSNGIQTPASTNFAYSLLSTSTGIIAYSTTTALDSTAAMTLMTNLYNVYNASNVKSDTTSASKIASLISGGTGSTALSAVYNGVVSKSFNEVIVPTCTSWTYTLGTCQANSTQSLTVATSSPAGCAGGTPLTTQSCSYFPPSCNNSQSITYAQATTNQSSIYGSIANYIGCNINDYPGGAAIIAGTTVGSKVLISASNDSSTGAMWKTTTSDTLNTSSLTDGAANTSAMLDDDIVVHIAGQICTTRGVSWYLPAYNELDTFYTNLKASSIGSFANNAYTSSTQYGSSQNYATNFSDGSLATPLKNMGLFLGHHVRCASRF